MRQLCYGANTATRSEAVGVPTGLGPPGPFEFCLAISLSIGCSRWAINNYIFLYQHVPHKAVAEVSKIANYRRLVAVNHGPQSKSTDGSKSGRKQRSVVVVVIVVAMQA